MFRRTLIGFAVMVPILAIAVGVGLSQRGKDFKSSPDLGGEWLLDRSQSDTGRGMGGPGGGAGRGGSGRGGRWDGSGSGAQQHEGMNGRERGARGGRPARLPERIQIEQKDGFVRIADSTGLALEEIGIGKPGTAGGAGADPNLPRLSGEWSKDRLQVMRQGRRGKMTQTFGLEEDGRVLVIRTKMESDGSRPSREFKRVYRRIGT
jgi:hypothetical protein